MELTLFYVLVQKILSAIYISSESLFTQSDTILAILLHRYLLVTKKKKTSSVPNPSRPNETPSAKKNTKKQEYIGIQKNDIRSVHDYQSQTLRTRLNNENNLFSVQGAETELMRRK